MSRKDEVKSTSGRGVTPKQEKFCQLYIELGNASEAYRQSYDCSKMKADSINRLAKKELDKIKIRSRLEELQSEHQVSHNLSVDDLLEELEEARQMGIQKKSAIAMVSATMGKAKILGFDKQVIDLQSGGKPLPTTINVSFGDGDT